MLKKNIGKISFFIFNLLLLAGGVLFIKNRESGKVVKNTDASGSKEIQNYASDVQNPYVAPSSSTPLAEEDPANKNNAAPDIKSNPTPTIAPVPAPAANSSPSNPKPKTRTS